MKSNVVQIHVRYMSNKVTVSNKAARIVEKLKKAVRFVS